MKIVEIQAGVAIVMQISMNGQTIELPTVSVTVQDGALVTEAITLRQLHDMVHRKIFSISSIIFTNRILVLFLTGYRHISQEMLSA